MFFVKKIVVAGILAITLYPAFLLAMHESSVAEVQQNFKQALDTDNFEQAEYWLGRGANSCAIYPVISPPVNLGPYRMEDATLLEYYAQFGKAEQVEFLLEHGADPFHRNRVGYSALHVGVCNDCPEEALKIIPLLIERVGVNYPTIGYLKKTALAIAVRGCVIPIIQLLLRHKADINSITIGSNGSTIGTPLDSLLGEYRYKSSESKRTYFAGIKLLYRHGANPFSQRLSDCLTHDQVAELMEARARRIKMAHFWERVAGL